jgi:flagellar hook assembly protein FlgD
MSRPVLALTAAPNPFTSKTHIHLVIREAGPVKVQLYDVSGRRLRTLVDGTLPAGAQSFEWDGRG